MTLYHRSRLAVLTGAFAALIAAGCGGSKAPEAKEYKGVPVSGVVLQGGKPVKLKQDETITVSFMMLEGEGAEKVSFAGEAKPEDGTFTINGSSGQGIPPGRYKVMLATNTYGGAGEDRFAERFDAASPLFAEVGSEPGQTFEIDIAKRSVKKK